MNPDQPCNHVYKEIEDSGDPGLDLGSRRVMLKGIETVAQLSVALSAILEFHTTKASRLFNAEGTTAAGKFNYESLEEPGVEKSVFVWQTREHIVVEASSPNARGDAPPTQTTP